MPKALNLIGQRFGRLLVLEKLDQRDIFKKVVWKCKCDCGNFHNINTKSLRSSNVKSCGCLRIEKTTKHGMRNSRTYRIWSQMRTRCENPNHEYFSRYGERGIRVCARWKNFINFYTDMGEAPNGKTLDRIDNNKGYSKANCQWASRKQQAINRSTTVFITFQNETRSVSDWARKIGVCQDTLHYRLKAGWSIEKALTTPVNSKMNRQKK